MSTDCPTDIPAVAGQNLCGSGAVRVDGRTVNARRLRDLKAALAEGLPQPLPVAADQLVRNVAMLALELELMQAQRAAGGEIDPGAYATLSNTQMRLMARLERLKVAVKTKPAMPTLKDYLSRSGGQLCGLERRVARSGKDSIDHAPGGHDDVGNAVAGALVDAASRRGPMIIPQSCLQSSGTRARGSRNRNPHPQSVFF